MKSSKPSVLGKWLRKRLLVCLGAFLLLSSTASAQPPLLNFVILDAPVAPVNVGSSFTVRIAADFIGAPSLGADAVEVHLQFDRTKLQITALTESATTSAFDSKPQPLETSPFPSDDPGGDGIIDYTALTSLTPPATDFDIFSVTFQVIAGGGTTTPLTFLEILDPGNGIFKLTDALNVGSSIKNTVINASISINALGCTEPAVVLSGTAACNGGPITLNLQSSSAGTGPFDLTVNGTTYNNISVGGAVFPAPFTVPTQSLFPGNPTPSIPTNNDIGEDPLAAIIEVGAKFQASEAGFIKGVRFYNGADNSGTYTGKLYTAAGVELASVLFTGVTTNAWQEALFATPVAITANTTYVVTYLSVGGYYAATAGGYNNAVVSGSLTGLEDVALERNGVYLYGGGFPTNSFGSTDYSADVIFSPAAVTFNLTSVTDDLGCTSTGTPNLQSLTVTSSSCATLPVTLLNFSASAQDNKITLKWSTSTELNNKGFEIFRSTNGSSNWQSVGFVNGAGNSTSIKNYSFVDTDLPAKRYYYQLKQIDIDNRFKYSAVVSALIDGKSAFLLEQNFPNPFRGQATNIRFTLPARENVNLSLFDMNGRLVKVIVNGMKDSGTHVIPFEAGTLGAGVYYYRLQAGEFNSVKKMTIQ